MNDIQYNFKVKGPVLHQEIPKQKKMTKNH